MHACDEPTMAREGERAEHHKYCEGEKKHSHAAYELHLQPQTVNELQPSDAEASASLTVPSPKVDKSLKVNVVAIALNIERRWWAAKKSAHNFGSPGRRRRQYDRSYATRGALLRGGTL